MTMTWLRLPAVLGAMVSVGLFLTATAGNAAIKDPYHPAEVSVVKVKCHLPFPRTKRSN